MGDQEANQIILNGIGGSPGICIGRAYLVDREGVDVVKKYSLDNNDVDGEVSRFKEAVTVATEELREIIASISEEFPEQVQILETHSLLLKDKMLYDKVIEIIQKDMVNAEWALKKILHELKDVFNRMSDPYFRERASDVVHVSERVMRNLVGVQERRIEEIDKRVILVARDLSPAETSQIQLERIQGFITDLGGKTSHTSIIARTLEVPAVLGLGNITQLIKHDDIIIVDGSAGIVILSPTEESLIRYHDQKELFKTHRSAITRTSHLPAKTIDGIEKRVMGNIELPEEVVSVLDYGGNGIGLYRTEFLYMSLKELPSETQLFNNYREVAELVAPHPVTIRTLDINGDKVAGSIYSNKEINPALGLRAIRYCLKRPDVFITQLKAILRAAAFGNIRLLFPMISGIDELIKAKAFLNHAAEELEKEGVLYNKDIKVGMMIEVPSAVILADLMAEYVDFFSIGTNDLIQYSLAIDRGNMEVAHLFQPLHPAIIRMVKNVAEAGHAKNIKIFMCGEMAADPFNMPILLALDIDEFSMNPPAIPVVKSIIRKISTKNLDEFLKQVLKMSTYQDIMNLIEEKYGKELSVDRL
ncbi:Phosphoenolpyruvate-protein phosphotransferase [Candidatus Magnetomoraceae bacterium gMMP-13]